MEDGAFPSSTTSFKIPYRRLGPLLSHFSLSRVLIRLRRGARETLPRSMALPLQLDDISWIIMGAVFRKRGDGNRTAIPEKQTFGP
jgi:hypothetical protein